jgi:hypothetical protein
VGWRWRDIDWDLDQLCTARDKKNIPSGYLHRVGTFDDPPSGVGAVLRRTGVELVTNTGSPVNPCNRKGSLLTTCDILATVEKHCLPQPQQKRDSSPFCVKQKLFSELPPPPALPSVFVHLGLRVRPSLHPHREKYFTNHTESRGCIAAPSISCTTTNSLD